MADGVCEQAFTRRIEDVEDLQYQSSIPDVEYYECKVESVTVARGRGVGVLPVQASAVGRLGLVH